MSQKGLCLLPANWKMQTVCVLHGCLCQYGITTGSQAGIARKLDEWLG